MFKESEGGYYEDDESKTLPTTNLEPKSRKTWIIISCVLLFLLALGVRLYYLLVASDPDNPGAGWFGDSYHHWQIAYLTKEIGLSQGFLRVWDLKGMDLFWGLLHPLTLAFTFIVTNNNSMALARSITCIAGATSVVFVFLIGKKYWNMRVGYAGALFAALCSVIIFNDATGMVEPLGIPFLLAGVYFWSSRPFLSGIVLGLALMTRSEYWMYTVGLIAAFVVWDRAAHTDKKVLLLLGFGIVLLPYMKYLLDYTANPIYPFYQNVFKNIKGEWQYKKVLEPADLQGQFIFRIILAITTFFTAIVLWKRPKGWQFHLLGLGHWLFLGLTFGVSNYIKSWADYVWVVRFMLFPYTYLGVVLAVILFYTLPNTIKIFNHFFFVGIKFIILLAIIAATQLAWYEIYKYYEPTEETWSGVKSVTAQLIAPYQGGKILMAEGNPDVTYAMVQYHNIKGKDLLSQMYDPFGYAEEAGNDPIANWNSVNELNKEGLTYREEMLTFLKKKEVSYILTYASRERYQKLGELEPGLLEPVGPPISNLILYKVNSEQL